MLHNRGGAGCYTDGKVPGLAAQLWGELIVDGVMVSKDLQKGFRDASITQLFMAKKGRSILAGRTCSWQKYCLDSVLWVVGLLVVGLLVEGEGTSIGM